MFTSSIAISFIGFIVDTQQPSYVIYLNENQKVAKITFDQDLNYNKEVKSFNSYDDITDYGNFGGIATNSTIYLISFNTYQDVYENLSMQTSIYLTDNNNGESECENFIPQSNSTEGGLTEDLLLSLIQELNETASFAYIKSNQLIYIYFFTQK